MGDSGEGLVDSNARIQERLDDQARDRQRAAAPRVVKDPERVRALESLRLARADVERQHAVTTHATRREQLAQALAELDRRIAATERPQS